MLCQQTTHHWLGRFAVQLMQIDERVTLRAAVARGVTAHAHCGDMDPEQAAQLHAEIASYRPRAAANQPGSLAAAG